VVASTTGNTALIDSVDADDGELDGTCSREPFCESLFASNGQIDFTFDATTLGGLPKHAGAVWTDGNAGCDAIFEAFDADNVSLGTLTATMVGDADNYGGTGEDRFFGVVHEAGILRISLRSSAGGVEVDHLQFGR
jgi:hypothetical protein